MNTDDFHRSLPSLFRELVHGAPPGGAFVLNPGDEGLLAALDRLAAADASRRRDGGAPIAAHVDHLRYGLSLMNRWAAGEENPLADADWTASWRLEAVSDGEWAALRERLRAEVDRWLEALEQPRRVTGVALDGVIGSVVHLAYHMGAIRQIAAGTRGPRAEDAADAETP
jgi:glutathione S-transferase